MDGASRKRGSVRPAVALKCKSRVLAWRDDGESRRRRGGGEPCVVTDERSEFVAHQDGGCQMDGVGRSQTGIDLERLSLNEGEGKALDLKLR